MVFHQDADEFVKRFSYPDRVLRPCRFISVSLGLGLRLGLIQPAERFPAAFLQAHV